MSQGHKHDSYESTRQINYDRCRREGIPADTARKVADEAALIKTMEGMSFDTPKGKMTFRKEDHQAMQSMYHFKIKVDPAFAWGVPELIREIKPEQMNVPIRNNR